MERQIQREGKRKKGRSLNGYRKGYGRENTMGGVTWYVRDTERKKKQRRKNERDGGEGDYIERMRKKKKERK